MADKFDSADSIYAKVLKDLASLPSFQPIPAAPKIPHVEVSLEKAQRFASAHDLIARLASRVRAWTASIPANQQAVVVAILQNGLMVNVSALSAEGHNGILIEGFTDNGPCIVLTHQANVQLLCFIATLEEGAQRRIIGFNIDWTGSQPQAPDFDPATAGGSNG